MSDKNGSEGRIQWSEALWSKGVLDTAARAL